MDRKIFSRFLTFLAITSSVAAEGFWNVRVNPQSVAVIPYHSSHVSVWEHASVRGRYFAAPLACLQPESAQHFDNFFTGKSQVNFRVLLWSREAKQVVYEYMRSRVNASILPDDVELLPMERIRLVWTDRQQPLPDYYQVGTEWRANSHLPTVVTFHIMCADQERCAALETGMKTTPEAFHGLHFEYEINAQKTATRRLVVKGEHLIGGQLYTRLVNMPVQSGLRYLSSQDVARLAAQTVTNVLTTVTTDEDYVDEEDEVSVTDMLRTVLQRQAVSTDTFTPRTWEMVFWSADKARPDKVARYLNQLLTEDATNTSRFLLNQSERSTAAEASLGLLDLFGTSTGSATVADKQDVVNEVLQRHSHVQWNGAGFTVKPSRMSRLNLATLNQSTTIAASQVQVRRYDSVKSVKLRARCGADNQTTRLTPGIVESRIERKLEAMLNTTRVTERKLEAVLNATRASELRLERKLENELGNKLETALNSTANIIESKMARKLEMVLITTRATESRLQRNLETVLLITRGTELRLKEKLETVTRNTESSIEQKLETVQNELAHELETVTRNIESRLERTLETVQNELAQKLGTVQNELAHELETITRNTESRLERKLETVQNVLINASLAINNNGYCYIRGRHCAVTPYKTKYSTFLLACRTLCSRDARCMGFDHYGDQDSCFLKDVVCPASMIRTESNDERIHYDKLIPGVIRHMSRANYDVPCQVLGPSFRSG